MNTQHEKELMPNSTDKSHYFVGSAVRGIQATRDGMDRLCVRQRSKMGVGLLSTRIPVGICIRIKRLETQIRPF